MSVITLVPKSSSDIPTPPTGYVTFFVDENDKKAYVKSASGIITPLNDISSTKITDGVSLLGTINDVSSVVSPKNGDKYLIGDTPIGILVGNSKNIVVRDNSDWVIEQLPNNVIFSIKTSNNIKHYYNDGTFPLNTITKVTFESKVFLQNIISVEPNIETAFNNSTAFQINEYDVILVKWDNGGIIKMYMFVGVRNGSIWGNGGTSISTSSDFVELPVGRNEYEESLFRLFNDIDPTKKLKFDISQISTGAIRTIIAPNFDFDLNELSLLTKTDGSTPFTQPQVGVDAVNNNELVTLSQALGLIGSPIRYHQEILSADLDGTYIPVGTELRYVIQHNMDLSHKSRFIASFIDKLSSVVITPDSIEAVDKDTIYVVFDGVPISGSDGVYISMLSV